MTLSGVCFVEATRLELTTHQHRKRTLLRALHPVKPQSNPDILPGEPLSLPLIPITWPLLAQGPLAQSWLVVLGAEFRNICRYAMALYCRLKARELQGSNVLPGTPV